MAMGTLNRLVGRLGGRPKDAQQSFDRGAAALAAGDIEEGRLALVEAVNLAPEDLERAYAAGELLAGVECSGEADQIFRHLAREIPLALEAEPMNLALHQVAASLRERNGEIAEAAEHLGLVLTIEPDHPKVNRRLAVILAQLGDTRGAIRCWRRVLAQTGHGDVEAMTFLGMALSTDGQHEEAVALLTEVAERHRLVSSAQADLGMALLSAKRPDKALLAFSRARDLDPRSVQAQCGLGLVYQSLGRWWEAADAFRLAEQLGPDNPVAPMNLAAVLHTLGEHTEARKALLRASMLAPDDPEIRHALAQEEAVPEPMPDAVTRPAVHVPAFEVSLKGDLRSSKFLDVLEYLRAQPKTGALVISSRQGGGFIRVARGKVVSASAPLVKRLGQALVDHNLVSAPELESVAASIPEDREDLLATALIKSGKLEKTPLATVMSRQVLQAIEDMMAWNEGQFEFHDSHNEAVPSIAFDLQRVIATLVSRRDDRVRGASTARK